MKFPALFYPLEVLGTVVETNDRLSTGGNTQQNRNHDLIDLHDNACSRQRNVGTVNGLCTVLGQQVIGQRHNNGNGKLRDEAAQAKDNNIAAEVLRSLFSITSTAELPADNITSDQITSSSDTESSNTPSQEHYSSFSSETDPAPLTNDITGSLSTPTWWTERGYSYHFSSSCPTLSRSASVRSGTLADALDAGKTDPCNICANG